LDSSGIIQMAGQIQSPTGMRAMTSTLPYRIDALPLVTRRAPCTGLIMDPRVELETATQAVTFSAGSEQRPSAVRLSV
jgi:hypothetical protein